MIGQTISRAYTPQINASLLSNIDATLSKKEFIGSKTYFNSYKIRGKIVTKGVDVKFPIENFNIFIGEKEISIQNQPKDAFPQIRIVDNKEFSGITIETGLSDSSSVDSDVLYTRLFFSLLESESIVIEDEHNKQILELKLTDNVEELIEAVKHRAKIFRKLKFIEDFFNTKFRLPSGISPDEVRTIETVFRGITEGNFTIPVGSQITIPNYEFSSSLLNKPPFSNYGNFSHILSSGSVGLFGKNLSVGKISIQIEKAGLVNPSIVKNLKSGDVIDELHLFIFDHQLTHFFEKYNTKDKIISGKQKLNRFKTRLRKVEPDTLVSLIDEPLAIITEQVAAEIVNGLLQFHRLSVNYSTKQPVLKDNNWNVPIFTNNSFVTDIIINSKNGQLIPSNSIEKIKDYSRPIWEVISEISNEASDEEWARVPTDGSINHDHYLYGAPRKEK